MTLNSSLRLLFSISLLHVSLILGVTLRPTHYIVRLKTHYTFVKNLSFTPIAAVNNNKKV